jgi:hypothetical protein
MCSQRAANPHRKLQSAGRAWKKNPATPLPLGSRGGVFRAALEFWGLNANRDVLKLRFGLHAELAKDLLEGVTKKGLFEEVLGN